MSAPEPKFDAELAWDIQEWFHDEDSPSGSLSRVQIKALAGFLTEKGYHKGPRGITASLEYIESVGAKLADEFLPVFDALSKRHKTEK